MQFPKRICMLMLVVMPLQTLWENKIIEKNSGRNDSFRPFMQTHNKVLFSKKKKKILLIYWRYCLSQTCLGRSKNYKDRIICFDNWWIKIEYPLRIITHFYKILFRASNLIIRTFEEKAPPWLELNKSSHLCEACVTATATSQAKLVRSCV